MADHFDPYHKWLGIPPTEQPPNHYRLLGVALFESDPDVIDAAANRQMTYLHQCATGPQLQYSQKLLNEVSAARLCLLNPQMKARYDAGLKQATPAAPPTRVVKKVVRVVRAAESEPEPEATPPLIPGFDPDAPTTTYRRRRGGVGTAAAVVLILGLLAGGGWYYWKQQQTPTDVGTSTQVDPGNHSVAGTDNPKPPETNPTPAPPPGTTRPDNTGNSRTTPTGNTGNGNPPPGNGNTRPVAPGTPTFKNTAGMEFMPLPAGKFLMGSRPGPLVDGDEMPEHEVRITRAYYLGITEVTQKQWANVMGDPPQSQFRGDDLPADSIRLAFARDFCERLSRRENRRYRLPTEAEWEYAASAGATTVYSFGDDEGQLGDYAWFRQNSDFQTHPVARKKPNAWGLYDMHGNVAEWCQDFYWRDWYRHSPTDDPTGPTEAVAREEETELAHLARGGHWDIAAGSCRLTYRGVARPEIRDPHVGFRVVLEMTPEEIARVTGPPVLQEEIARVTPPVNPMPEPPPENNPATTPVPDPTTTPPAPERVPQESYWPRVAPLLKVGEYDEAVTTLKDSRESVPEAEQESLRQDIADLEQVAALRREMLEILRRLPVNTKIRAGGIGNRSFLRFDEDSLSVVVQSGSSEKKIPLNELRINEWRLLFPVTRVSSAETQLAWAILYAFHPQGEPDRADEIFKQLKEKTPAVERWIKRTRAGADG